MNVTYYELLDLILPQRVNTYRRDHTYEKGHEPLLECILELCKKNNIKREDIIKILNKTYNE